MHGLPDRFRVVLCTLRGTLAQDIQPLCDTAEKAGTLRRHPVTFEVQSCQKRIYAVAPKRNVHRFCESSTSITSCCLCCCCCLCCKTYRRRRRRRRVRRMCFRLLDVSPCSWIRSAPLIRHASVVGSNRIAGAMYSTLLQVGT